MSTVTADVLPITRVAPTSTPEPSIGDKTCKKMGSGMAIGESVGPVVPPARAGVGVITAMSIGATRGTGDGANSSISSNGARTAGAGTVGEMGREPVGVGSGVESVTSPGPQATKPSAQKPARTSLAKIFGSIASLFLIPSHC